jgi:hypothetical protein
VVIQTTTPITTVEPPLPAREVTGDSGDDSGIQHAAEVTLRADGSADLELDQTYGGRYAVQLRAILDKVPEARRKEIVEAQLLGLSLPGGRVTSLDVPNIDALDEAVRLSIGVEAPTFARVSEGELSLEVPFLGSLARLVQLPERETPLYISERIATGSRVELRITLPDGAQPIELGAPVTLDDPRLGVEANDRLEGKVLVLTRAVKIPAGRVQPADYASFKALVLRGDEALNRKVRIRLK